MKKLICLVLVCIICVSCTGCSATKETKEKAWSPLTLVDEVKDQYDNVLQQTFYNEETGELILREYTYNIYKNKWVCVDQQTTIIKKEKNCPPCNNTTTPIVDTSLKIYHNSEITNNGITILDNELVNIALVGYYEKESWYEFAYELRVTNKTNKVLTITIDDATIMNINCKPLFSVDHIEAGKTTFFRVGWDKDTLTRNYIPYIDNVEFMIRIFDNEDWTVPAITGARIMIKTED